MSWAAQSLALRPHRGSLDPVSITAVFHFSWLFSLSDHTWSVLSLFHLRKGTLQSDCWIESTSEDFIAKFTWPSTVIFAVDCLDYLASLI